MKNIFTLILTACCAYSLSAQSLIGAWESIATADDGSKIKSVVVFSDDYQVMSQYDADSGAFIQTNGGSWSITDNQVTEVVEFDSKNPDRVGSSISFEVYVNESTMGIVGHDMEWTKIDDGKPGALSGAWLFSGRKRDGQLQTRDTNQPRKTMKMMSGTRFQWIAYNTETKQFMGTGGGTYKTEDGKYTEHIEFFSRDDAKVGLSLGFDFELIDGKWHHSGLSSKGAPIYEVWSMRVE